MFRLVVRVALAGLLVIAGWSLGRAQSAQPDFEIVVNAPVGETTITCKRGCNLAWVERGIPDNVVKKDEFRFRCGGGGVERCSSATVGGWVGSGAER
jgi:hypothetical protein